MGIFDGGDIDPLTGGLLGATSAYAQGLGPSRLPINPMQGILGAIGGFGQGYEDTQMGNIKQKLYSQEAQKNELANFGVLQRMGLVNQALVRRGYAPLPLPGGANGAGGAAMGQSAPAGAPGASALPYDLTGIPRATGAVPYAGKPGFNDMDPTGIPTQRGGSGALFDDALIYDMIFPGSGAKIMEKQYPGPTAAEQSLRALNIDPASPTGRQLLAYAAQKEVGDPGYLGNVKGSEAAATAPYDAVKALLSQAGRIHAIGPDQKGVTGFQAIPGLDKIFERVLGGTPYGAGGAAPGAPPTSQPSPQAAAAPQRAPGASAEAPAGIDPAAWAAVPKLPLPDTPDRGPGGVMQGISSAQRQMQEKANVRKEEIDKAGTAAQQSLSSLATLGASLDSGQFNTNATAPVRATISSYVSALTGDKGLAKSLTNIDPEAADLFQSGANRMGLQFARQTEGAREAVAAIKIALGANPSMAMQTEANKMLVQIMQHAALADADKQKYSDAFFQKNGHNALFEGWYNRERPAADFTTGKAMPYAVPMTGNQVNNSLLLPGFTYKSPDGKIGVWTGSGFKLAQ